MKNKQINLVIEAAKEHALLNHYGNFEVLSVYKSQGMFSYLLDVRYDWIDPELNVNYPGFETSWHCGFTGKTPCFVY